LTPHTHRLRSSPVEVDPESEPVDEDGEAEDRAD
jgi:hypothetical protein